MFISLGICILSLSLDMYVLYFISFYKLCESFIFHNRGEWAKWSVQYLTKTIGCLWKNNQYFIDHKMILNASCHSEAQPMRGYKLLKLPWCGISCFRLH